MKKGKSRKPSPKLRHFYFFFFSVHPVIHDSFLVQARKRYNIDDHTFRYEAFYFGGEDLRVYPVAEEKRQAVVISFPGLKKTSLPIQAFPLEDLPLVIKGGMKNSWDLFYKHASLDSILRNMTGLYRLEEPTEEEIFKAAGEVPLQLAKYSIIPPDRISPLTGPNYEVLLTLIRDKPYSLHNRDIRDRFIDILIEARYSTDSKEAKRARYLLRDCLIPISQGGRKPLPPGTRLDLAIFLLKRVAKYISKRCKEALDHCEKQDLKEYLMREDKEYRISMLSDNDLKTLIEKPSAFVENLINTRLDVSIRTLNNHEN